MANGQREHARQRVCACPVRENTHAPFWEVCKRSGCREVLETYTKDAMTASEMILDMDEVLSKVSRPLARKIEYSVDLIRKAERMALRLDPENGFYNTFSGGKDSLQILSE